VVYAQKTNSKPLQIYLHLSSSRGTSKDQTRNLSNLKLVRLPLYQAFRVKNIKE